VKIRIRWGKRRLLLEAMKWAERAFLVTALLTLGFATAAYLEAHRFQISASERFGDTPHSHPVLAPELTFEAPEAALPTPSRDGSPISRIEIPRLGVSVVVVEGVRARDLLLGVGHIPGTAFPGELGNIGIAGHRDTFFRKLGQIRDQDAIILTTLRGSFQYLVESIQIVDPTDIRALQPSDKPILTLVTCYPFSYVGPAPERFIVRAREGEIHEDPLLK
jgi:sortase A